jgi:hypothetical protein
MGDAKQAKKKLETRTDARARTTLELDVGAREVAAHERERSHSNGCSGFRPSVEFVKKGEPSNASADTN